MERKLLVLVILFIVPGKGSDVETNSTVSSSSLDHELTMRGLKVVSYNLQKDYLRSKEYHQVMSTEIEDIRNMVQNTETLVMRQASMLSIVEAQLKKLSKTVELMDEVPGIKSGLELLSYNISRVLSDTSKIYRAQQTLATTKALNDFLLQLGGDQLWSNTTSRMLTLLPLELPQSCTDIGDVRSGVNRIHPPGFNNSFEVYCDQNYLNGGWTVIQNRFDGSLNFYRGWNEYENGFGSLRGEFWLGLKKIHEFTYARQHELHIVMEDFDGKTVVAKYSYLLVGGPEEKYALNSLGTYSGDAGDSLSIAVKQKFSTIDSDNDSYEGNCAKTFMGAWWHKACHESNLNGLYLKGERKESSTMMCWKAFRGYNYGLKRSRMMIRPVN